MFRKLLSPQIIFTFLICICSLQVSAGYQLEPYFGMRQGNWDGFFTSGTTDGAYNGQSYGLRVALTHLNWELGFDYGLASVSEDSDVEMDISYNDLGILIGYNFTSMFRLYYVHIPDSRISLEGANISGGGTADFDLGGPASKLGFSYTGFTYVNINLEYHTYNQDRLVSATGGNLDENFKSTGFGASLSFPFPFFASTGGLE